MMRNTEHHYLSVYLIYWNWSTLQVLLDTATGIFECLAACREIGCDVVVKVDIEFKNRSCSCNLILL